MSPSAAGATTRAVTHGPLKETTIASTTPGGSEDEGRELRRELKGLRQAVELAPYCAYAVGGAAEFLFEAATTADLQRAVVAGHQAGMPVTVLGQATNVLIADRGLPGLVVLARNAEAHVHDDVLNCDAGAVLAPVVTSLAERGLAGLEFAGNIPGSVGGAVVGNAGAYGRAVGDALVTAEVLIGDQVRAVTPADLRLGYRTSALKQQAGAGSACGTLAGACVLRATFVLSSGSSSALVEEIARDARLRRSKHPLEYASCGSYFRNPSPQRPAALLIEQAGLKGLRLGLAEVSRRHANFLVALKGARASDILALAEEVKRRVLEHSGEQLVEEVVRLGFSAEALAADPPPIA
jgi:UDP-N-acetylmuramate dehydrogenase